MREVSEAAAAHPHASPRSLALDLDELEEDRLLKLEDQLSACRHCLVSLEALVYWLDALGHWDPRVGPEFVTRHRLMAGLLFSHELHPQRLDRARGEEQFHEWGLSRLLLDESRRACPLSLSYAFQLGELTHTIAETLDVGFYGACWVADLRAEAAANLAVLERRRNRLDEARELFGLARELLEAGTGRAEISRAIECAESLFPRDNPPAGAPCGSTKSAESQPPFAQEPHFLRPAHQLLERCQAAQGRQ